MARRGSRRSKSRRSEFFTETPLSPHELARRDAIDLRHSQYDWGRTKSRPIRRPKRPKLVEPTRRRSLNRVIDAVDNTEMVSRANMAFADAVRQDRRKAHRKPLTAVDRCVKRCKGKSSRRRGRWRGGTSPGFARFLKDKLCKLRCR